jgi:dihydrofolate synthase/folylpolyglutamate synthase
MVDDKDIDTVLTMLPKDAVYYFTKAQSKRAIPEQRILEKATALGLHGTAFPNVKDAYRQAMSEADPDDFIFVGGSSYVVADLLS